MEQKSAERIFLHDIASPLTTIQLNLENAVSMLNENKPAEVPSAVVLLEGCLAQLKKASDLLRSRRQSIIESEENK